jgi:hypothetical protein
VLGPQTRDLLLAGLRPLDSFRDVVAAFEAVGSTRPLHLVNDQDERLFAFVDAWTDEPGSVERLPPDLFNLRAELRTELMFKGIGLEHSQFPDRIVLLSPRTDMGGPNMHSISWHDKARVDTERAMRSCAWMRDIVELIDAAASNPILITAEQEERLSDFFEEYFPWRA